MTYSIDIINLCFEHLYQNTPKKIIMPQYCTDPLGSVQLGSYRKINDIYKYIIGLINILIII